MATGASSGRNWWRYWVADVVAGARLWLLHQLMRALPTDWSSRVGGTIARIAGPRLYKVAHARAGTIIGALRPDLATEPMIDAALRRAWDSIGRTHAEFSAEDRLWGEGRIRVEGAEWVSGNRPLIVAGLHVGNWELLPIVLGFLGHRIIDVYQPQPNRFVDRIAMRARLRAADAVAVATGRRSADIFTLVAPSPRAGAELVRAIKAGFTMMMYVDEEIRGKTLAPSFGDKLPKEGNLLRAVRIARMTGARIVPAYVERLDGARFVAHFLPPLAEQGEANEAALNAAIAAPVRRHLDQWFMLLTYRLTGAAGARPAEQPPSPG